MVLGAHGTWYMSDNPVSKLYHWTVSVSSLGVVELGSSPTELHLENAPAKSAQIHEF